MSTQRGNSSRTRPQKHKNRHVFRNDLHDKTPQQKRLNSLQISEVCQHCKQVIEWKIKYKKYKPLTQLKTCAKCSQKKIRRAYHVLCRECALLERVCAKCLTSAEEVDIEPPQPTPEEQLKLKVEMERLIKSFPERKRRAFLRYMENGKEDKGEGEESTESAEEAEDKTANNSEVVDPNSDAKQTKARIPYTRDELLRKIVQLQLKDDEGDDPDSDDDFSNSDFEYSSDD